MAIKWKRVFFSSFKSDLWLWFCVYSLQIIFRADLWIVVRLFFFFFFWQFVWQQQISGRNWSNENVMSGLWAGMASSHSLDPSHRFESWKKKRECEKEEIIFILSGNWIHVQIIHILIMIAIHKYVNAVLAAGHQCWLLWVQKTSTWGSKYTANLN